MFPALSGTEKANQVFILNISTLPMLLGPLRARVRELLPRPRETFLSLDPFVVIQFSYQMVKGSDVAAEGSRGCRYPVQHHRILLAAGSCV